MKKNWKENLKNLSCSYWFISLVLLLAWSFFVILEITERNRRADQLNQASKATVIRVIWYVVTTNGIVTNVVLAANRGQESCFFYKDTGKVMEGKSSDTNVPFGKANLPEWKKLFVKMEKGGIIPPLPLSFIEGEYKVESFSWRDEELVLSLQGSNGPLQMEKKSFDEFGSRPYFGPTFRFVKLAVDGKEKLFPVVFHKEKTGEERFTLEMNDL